MNGWSKASVIDKVFTHLQKNQLLNTHVDAVSMDSTAIKLHPDGTGALKKTMHKP